MNDKTPADLPASVRARLLNRARVKKEDFNLTLLRYALERLMYRISVSRYADAFILKGAMLFDVWGGPPYRATRDMDLMGKGIPSRERLDMIFKNLCRLEVQPDGLIFMPESVRVEEIREAQEYHGQRVRIEANLAGARIRGIQVDVGFGDAVFPKPKSIEYPTMLEFPPPKLAAYPPETVVAEKFQAIVYLGMANSRMKDFFDLHHMACIFDFNGFILSRAIKATFKARKMEIPPEVPVAFTPVFHDDREKQGQWAAFLRRNEIPSENISLPEVCTKLHSFLMPPAHAVSKRQKFSDKWLKNASEWVAAGR